MQNPLQLLSDLAKNEGTTQINSESIINAEKLKNSSLVELVTFIRAMPDYSPEELIDLMLRLDQAIENGELSKENLNQIYKIL